MASFPGHIFISYNVVQMTYQTFIQWHLMADVADVVYCLLTILLDFVPLAFKPQAGIDDATWVPDNMDDLHLKFIAYHFC